MVRRLRVDQANPSGLLDGTEKIPALKGGAPVAVTAQAFSDFASAGAEAAGAAAGASAGAAVVSALKGVPGGLSSLDADGRVVEDGDFGPRRAGLLGVAGDNFSADQTSAYTSALATVFAEGSISSSGRGGELILEPGRHKGTIHLTTADIHSVDLRGTRGTVLRAPADGDFVVVLKNNRFSNQPHFPFPRISSIAIEGNGSASRECCGIYMPREANLHDIGLAGCLIGLVSGDNYYGNWTDINVLSCDVGLFLGTLATGVTSITDLQNNSSEARTVTLPEAMANQNGHAGNKVIMHLRARTSRIAVAIVGRTEIVNVPLMEIIKPTIENNNIGMLVRNAQVVLHSPWFEGNSTSGTEDFNGSTYGRGGLVVAQGGAVTVKGGGRIEGLRVMAGGSCILDDDVALIGSPTVETGGSLILRKVRGDNIAIPYFVDRPRPAFGREGRGLTCYVKPKTQRVWGAQPKGGRVLIADDFTHSTFRTARLSKSSGAPQVLTWETAGGLFAEQKCLQSVMEDGYGFNLLLNDASSPLITNGKYYVLLLAVRTPDNCVFGGVNLSQFIGPSTTSVPADTWRTICLNGMLDNSGSVPGTAQYRIRVQSGLAGTTNVLFGGIQVVEFDHPDDLAEYCADPYFYMTEAA